MKDNIELNIINNNQPSYAKVDTKEADKNKKLGDQEIKTSCITCKFKPNCHDAIAYYKLAADSYKGANKFNDELYCRQKLVFCFQNQKILWEEGSEHQKIAMIYMYQTKNYDLTIKEINNAYKCYFESADYNDALNLLTDISDKFLELKEFQHAENCFKIGYDCFKQVFHVIATKKDEANMTLYNALYQYLNILIKNNKIKEAIEACASAITVIEKFEEDKSKIIETYAYILVFYILNRDVNEFKAKLESAKKQCEKSYDLRFLQDVESIPYDIENGQENQFKNHTVDIKVRLTHDVFKSLVEFYQKRNVKTVFGSRGNNKIDEVDDRNNIEYL